MRTIRTIGYVALLLGFAQVVFGAIVRITGSGMGCGDHWPDCWSMLMGGGGIAGGHVIGASDKTGGYVADRMVSMGDVYATIYKVFGIDWTKTYMTPIGRPIYIANALGDKQGEPIQGIV